MSSIDILLKALGVEPLTEQLLKLRKIEPLEIELVAERREEAKDLLETVKLLSRASKGKIKYRIVERKLPLETPPPCLEAVKRGKRFAYCGYVDEFLLPIIVEAILALGGVLNPRCPFSRAEEKRKPPRVRLYVVSGIPCIISGLKLAEYLACRDLFLEVVHAISFNNRMGKRIIRSVPLIVIDNSIFYEGTITSLNQVAEIFERKR